MNRMLVAMFGVGTLLLAGPALADDVRVVVGFKGDPDSARVAREGGAVHNAFGRVVVATMPAAAAARLRLDPDVAYVEADGIAEAIGADAGDSAKPGGGGSPAPAQTTPWGVGKVDAPVAWGQGVRGADVKVAVIDTGIDLDHPDLAANVKGSINFVKPGAPGDDDNGHGSHVAGTIAAVDNAIGYIGVAPEADLYAVKVLDRRGSGWWSDVAAGIDWAADNGMQIGSMSLGGSAGTTTLETACDAAAAAGVLLVAAAGNEGDGNTSTIEVSYPAQYDACVSVGATTSTDGLASFSNTGPKVEFSAPGVSVPSTYKSGGYKTLSGTSMATPHVSGMAALLLSSGSTSATVRADLRGKVVDLGPAGRDPGFGYGRMDWQP